VDLRGVRQENGRLQERVDVLEMLLQENQDRVHEAERLRSLLAMKNSLRLESVAAEVVAREGVPWFRSVMVNQGSRAGVRVNAAVITPEGIVGRVVAVGGQVSRIQLLLDRDCSAGVLVGTTRVAGVVQGQVGFADQGTSELLVKYVGALAQVAVGDPVVTSGLDGIYPKGLLVGRVRSVAIPSGLFKDVLVTPAVAFDRMEEVLILRRSEDDRSLTESVSASQPRSER
jgi:rod shape-determining protein MreC